MLLVSSVCLEQVLCQFGMYNSTSIQLFCIQNSSNNFQALRDVKYYQIIYETLAKQYEAARLDEAKDAPLIQVLDSATIPERKIKPQRALIIFGGIVSAFFAALFLTLIKSQKTIN